MANTSPAPPRFLVATDFSPQSLKALSVARALASRCGARLCLAHVRQVSDVRAAMLEQRQDLLASDEATLKKAIDEHIRSRLAALPGAGRDEEVKLLRGKTSTELRRESEQGYDLIVMGNRGRGAVTSALLGSNVLEMLAHCHVPILVVPAIPH